MSRVRASMVLLGICVLALAIGGLRLVTERPPLPTGSSYSAQPDGGLALFTWSQALGRTPTRLSDLTTSALQPPTTLLVLQPEVPLEPDATAAFEQLASSGGTLVLAGDSLPWLLYTRSLGVTAEPIRAPSSGASTPDSQLRLEGVSARYRLSAGGGTPLLVNSAGDWVALRMRYRRGSLIVLASPEPLTNAGLRDAATARFVYRDILSSVPVGGLAFDEVHHSFAPPTAAPITLNQLMLGTSHGRALLYAGSVVFAFLLLSGRRLGPPLRARGPTETRRTMYEHVQMLAGLYRRAGQLSVVRTAFSKRYAKLLAARGSSSPVTAAALATTLAHIEAARTESDLVSAVAGATL